tara:strand:+ start:175 stop:1023 length:849 start_codon:yes stop_codon:yes gene_type:complete
MQEIFKTMFLSDKICYLELTRSGSTHIHKLLKSYIPEGKQIGHHGPAEKNIINSSRFFLGSVRNPWDWYVSVWSFGCDQGGSVWYQLTQKKVYFTQLGFFLKPWLFPYVFLQQFSKPLNRWRSLFSDAQNTDNFREWLKLLLGNSRLYDVGHGYGFSSIYKFSGLMTYLYVTLHSSRRKQIYKNKINSKEQLVKFDKKYNFINYTIKNENLESNFIEFLSLAKIKIDEKEKEKIYNLKRTTASSNKRNLNDYYDQECLDLVQEKEKLIIDKYNYDLKKIKIR